MESYVGPYRILRLINRGGQGSVYLGYDERLKRRVALKIHHLPDERERRRALLNEARLVASLESPRVVQIYDLIESRNHLGMVMEYVPGCSLEDMLRIRLPTVPSAMRIGIDIAGALAVARQKGVVHGDLKAANVLITGNGRALITDFGIARSGAIPQLESRLPGSPSAMAPEQASGEVPGEQSDLFALGMLLYRMLCGEHPFVQEGRLDVRRLAAGDYVPLRVRVAADVELPPALLALVEQLLQREPQQRPLHTRGARQVLRAVARSYPMAAQNTLAAEARPFFREESAADMPPEVPEELAREGRSRLPPRRGGLAMIPYWFSGWRWPQRSAAIALVLALAMGPVLLAYSQRSVSVRFESPTISVDSRAGVIGELSREWLLGELHAALARQPGKLQLVDDADATTSAPIYAGKPSSLTPVRADYDVSSEVRCVQGLCILELRRSTAGRESKGVQRVIAPDQGPGRWSRTITDAVEALFP